MMCKTWKLGAILLMAAVLASAGCVIRVTSGGDGGGDSNQPPAATKITVRVVNTTGVSLDPQIFFSDQFVPPDQLFADGNKYTAYGVGTLGILADNDSASFNIECDLATTIGTKGGSFGDDLNNPIGVGQQIIVRMNESIFCGQTLTLTYRKSGSGYTTEFSVSP